MIIKQVNFEWELKGLPQRWAFTLPCTCDWAPRLTTDLVVYVSWPQLVCGSELLGIFIDHERPGKQQQLDLDYAAGGTRIRHLQSSSSRHCYGHPYPTRSDTMQSTMQQFLSTIDSYFTAAIQSAHQQPQQQQ